MRLLLSPRWLVIHAFAVLLVLAFVALGFWQLHRAEGGNARSYGYALEWPTFALLVIGFWLKIMRDELRHRRPATDPGPRDGRRGRRHADSQDAAELAAFNRFMAERAKAREQG